MWSYASLIKYNPCWLKVLLKGMSPHATDIAVYARIIFFRQP